LPIAHQDIQPGPSYVAQFSTFSPGISEKSKSVLTTVHWPRVKAIAAICRSMAPIVTPTLRNAADLGSRSPRLLDAFMDVLAAEDAMGRGIGVQQIALHPSFL
jgi:N-acyl-D-aspartate/D-glutamate deacylase